MKSHYDTIGRPIKNSTAPFQLIRFAILQPRDCACLYTLIFLFLNFDNNSPSNFTAAHYLEKSRGNRSKYAYHLYSTVARSICDSFIPVQEYLPTRFVTFLSVSMSPISINLTSFTRLFIIIIVISRIKSLTAMS